MEAYGRVYLIWNMVNGKRYVGKTTKTVEERFKRHAHANNTAISQAIHKYGKENFCYGVIKTCATKEELDACEIFYIAALHSKAPYGYNLTDGGDGGSGCIITDEMRKKRSAALKGKPKSPEHRANLSAALKGRFCGEKAHFFGRRHTAESLEKMSASKRGKKLSPETRKRMSETRKGRIVSPETRKKLSESRRGEKNPRFGKKNTPEHQARIVAAVKGKKLSPEHCTKISEALTGKTFTAERCANISAAKRGYSPYKNLLAELDAHQLSYIKLAKLLGLSQVNVSRKMRGERNFTERDNVKLVEIFGKTIEYLLARDDG